MNWTKFVRTISVIFGVIILIIYIIFLYIIKDGFVYDDIYQALEILQPIVFLLFTFSIALLFIIIVLLIASKTSILYSIELLVKKQLSLQNSNLARADDGKPSCIDDDNQADFH